MEFLDKCKCEIGFRRGMADTCLSPAGAVEDKSFAELGGMPCPEEWLFLLTVHWSAFIASVLLRRRGLCPVHFPLPVLASVEMVVHHNACSGKCCIRCSQALPLTHVSVSTGHRVWEAHSLLFVDWMKEWVSEWMDACMQMKELQHFWTTCT